MKSIFKFIGSVIVVYTLLILIYNYTFINKPVNQLFRNAIEFVISTTFQKVFVETQDFIDALQKKDPNIFYVVYGNPSVIEAEKAYAAKNNLKEYRISTFSFQFFIFQILIVPVAFLVSLFVATPMELKLKMKYLGISLLLFFIFIFIKSALLSYYSFIQSQIGIYSLSDTAFTLLARSVSALSLGFSIIFSFCIWLVLGFRYSNFYSQLNLLLKQIKP